VRASSMLTAADANRAPIILKSPDITIALQGPGTRSWPLAVLHSEQVASKENQIPH
jgi:hypothetical protein